MMRRYLVLGLLIAWVLLGPVGMAFDACGAMMVLCEIPCGAPSAMLDTAPTLAPLAAVALALQPARTNPPAVKPGALEPPPKSLRLSA
jgi:hypothetical protein